jgi:hypothetical protein
MKMLPAVILLALPLVPPSSIGASPSGAFVPSAPQTPAYVAGAPIPNAAGVPTWKNFQPLHEAWEKKVFMQAYRRSPVRDPEVEAFLSEAGRSFHTLTEQERIPLRTRGVALLQAGKNDPAVVLLNAVLQTSAPLREDLFRRAAVGLEKSHYSPFLRFTALVNVAHCLAERGIDAPTVAAADAAALEALKAAFKSESFPGDESFVLRFRFFTATTEGLFVRQGARVSEVFHEATGLPEWMRAYGEGRGYLAEAWKQRGGGWSSEVTDTGWKGWEMNLAKARTLLTKSWELNPRDPGAAALMIDVAMGDGGGKKEMRLWFDRSVAAQMDFFDAYRALLWALRPRWQGSHEEMLLLGDEFLQTARFDTCVPFHYFKVIADIASEQSEPSAIYRRPEIAANLKLVIERYLATPNSPLDLTFAHTAAAIFDFKAGNLAAAKSHLAAIQFKPASNIDAGMKDDLSKLMRSIASPTVSGLTNGATSAALKR